MRRDTACTTACTTDDTATRIRAVSSMMNAHATTCAQKMYAIQCRACGTPATSNYSPCSAKRACCTRYVFHARPSHDSAAYCPAHALHTVLPDVMKRRHSIVQDAEHINHKGESHSVAPTCVSSLASALGDSHSSTLSGIIRYNSTIV